MKILNLKQCGINKIIQTLRGQRSSAVNVEVTVRNVVEQVKNGGDKALFSLTEKFDGVKLSELLVTKKEIENAFSKVPAEVVCALRIAKKNIEKFQKTTFKKKERPVETQKGVSVWREFRPIEKVGLYVPGGKASYPSTVLMTAIPARIAGCKEVVVCSPCSFDGTVNPVVLVAAKMCGVTKIFKIGGAQAVAAMAYGTESVPKVSKIFGPGNQYVTTAKMLVYGEVDIDMPAGPSEVAVIADDSANPAWIAADLLSQLEHGADSQALLVAFSEKFVVKVMSEMESQMKKLSRKEIMQKSFQKSFAVIVSSVDESCEIINAYAPEHLEVVSKFKAQILKKINNAGSIFLGQYTCEPLGDYATGANHTLPTSGFAKMFSALSVSSFGKMIQMQKVSKLGMKRLAKTVTALADREGLSAHANAINIRLI